MPNTLYYGDNLSVLREHIPDESVDLIYLDPPFNSARNYNLLFKQVKGDSSPAQIMAFEDTWTWSPLLYDEFKQDLRNGRLFTLVAALYEILGPSEMMAYILMMAPRLLELHKKLKPTGSLYLHCDPVASHYLKIILDVVFRPTNFRNEIVWKRSDAHNDAKRQFGRISDRLLLYGRTSDAIFRPQFQPHEARTLHDWYQYLEFTDGTIRRMNAMERTTQTVPADARRFNADNSTSPNPRPNLMYEYKGYKPHANGWRYSRKRMEELDALGLLLFPTSTDGRIMVKRYLDEQRGRVAGDIWTDISMVRAGNAELRGYPTQKPLALLERIIAASSNEGDVVLDPFCGCGTAIVAAERMNRRWIGIDITYLAISEIIYRLQTEGIAGKTISYEKKGMPVDAYGALKLFEQTAPQSHKPFEQFCVSLVAGESRDKKGADRGIDGIIHLWDSQGKLRKAVISVKGGGCTLSHVRDFATVIKDNDAIMGLMITQKDATKEMELVCEQQGYADWHSAKKYPKMQMRTVRDLLENPRRPFEIPESARQPRTQGVGKVLPGQEAMEL